MSRTPARSRAKDKRKVHRVIVKKFPQYAFDGKARKGCESARTGRTERDVTMFCPDTDQVLGTRTLDDKEGEPAAARALLEHEGTGLPRGICTADAGITSPQFIAACIEAGHGYISAVKANAGHAFDLIDAYDWNNLCREHAEYSNSHGREEIRTIKRIAVASLDQPEVFEKYTKMKCVFRVHALARCRKTDALAEKTRYFIGDERAESLTLPAALTYIREHWRQESYHWVLDVVLKEDDSPQKNSNGSRVLGQLRKTLYTIGKQISSSVTHFMNQFSADPEGMLEGRITPRRRHA